MFPIGLQFQTFTSPRKIPMRLETSTAEDQKRRFLKIIGIDTPTTKHSKQTKDKKRNISRSRTQKRVR